MSTELGTDYANPDASIAIAISEQIKDNDGIISKPGDRLKYVITYMPDTSLLKQKRVLHPRVFLKKPHRLDVGIYVIKHVYGVLKQFLCLHQHKHILAATKTCVDRIHQAWHSDVVASYSKAKWNMFSTTK